ncbi:phage tail protein [Agrobacterium tumefaciens]|uniref:D-alanyl-D-alanine carboxypeptidase family protein n=1 Tax=Agrobacterium tumefaciens TaxID=358 RepID=UPI0021CE2DBC|nr:D-alanyl-D-alanine carboxypeptidase family protein [Agrobacterium tumefaciens]UXT48171.1 phage tail protein [Agrobacterium tumefaciens]
MNDDLLLVTFRANADKYRRDVDKARTYGGKRFRQMQTDAEKAGSGIEKALGGASKMLGTFGKGLLGGIAGGLAVSGLEEIIGRVGEVAKSVANVGNEAKRAGLSTKAFQELSYVAEQNRIEVDALVDGMKELNLRADEFIVTGKGSAAEAFQRLGYGADELKRKLADPSALLVEIIGKLETLDKAAQIRIADELFGGTGGERFVELIDRGAAGIRATIKEANDLGRVMDDDLIQRADEFNRKWAAVGGTINTYVKQAVLGLAFAADDFLDRFNKIEEQTTRNVQSALTSTYDKLNDAKERLSDLQLDKGIYPDDPTIDLNIERQKQLIEELTGEAMKLRDILDRRNGYSENFIYKTGEDAKGATAPVNGLNSALSGTSSAVQNAVAGIKSYSEAIRALKNEVPELAASLKDLDAKAKIEATYQKAIAGAAGQREIALANEMRGQALASLNLKSATDDPSRYLSVMLASGKSKSHVDGLANAFAEKLAKLLASLPDNLKGSVTINSGYRSVERQQQLWLDALKKYGSPEAARKWVAPPGNSQHNKGNAADLGYGSDAARQWVHQNAGNFGLSFTLSDENWHIEDADARNKQTASEIEKLTAAAKQQSDAYGQIIAGSKEYTAAQATERQALSMSGQQAAAYRFEQQMLAEAQRAGITLTDQQRQEIAALAQGMANADASVQTYVASQEQAAEVTRFFGEQAVDALSGLLSGTMTAEEALQNLIQTLIRAALQAAILGEGPLAGLLGGKGKTSVPSGGGGKKAGGSLLGSILGLKEGGHVRGPGTSTSDSIPARLSDGEFVVNAKATKRNRAVLEAINSGRIASFAAGGYAGDSPALRKPDLVAANSNAASGSPVNINTNVTVTASGGTPEQNTDLAGKVGKQIEQQMRGLVADELRRQSRPGNFGNMRSR